MIPHSTMKNNRNIIECFNNTYQGAPLTGKQTSACALDLRVLVALLVNISWCKCCLCVWILTRMVHFVAITFGNL